MKTKGINRVVMLVNDLDKAVALYSELLNTTFYPAAVAEEEGVRAALSYDALIELVSPILGSDKPMSVRLAQRIKEHGPGLLATIFSVDDVEEGRAKAEKMGIRVTGKIELGRDEIKRSFQNKFKTYIEYNLHPEDTCGAFVVLGQSETELGHPREFIKEPPINWT